MRPSSSFPRGNSLPYGPQSRQCHGEAHQQPSRPETVWVVFFGGATPGGAALPLTGPRTEPLRYGAVWLLHAAPASPRSSEGIEQRLPKPDLPSLWARSAQVRTGVAVQGRPRSSPAVAGLGGQLGGQSSSRDRPDALPPGTIRSSPEEGTPTEAFPRPAGQLCTPGPRWCSWGGHATRSSRGAKEVGHRSGRRRRRLKSRLVSEERLDRGHDPTPVTDRSAVRCDWCRPRLVTRWPLDAPEGSALLRPPAAQQAIGRPWRSPPSLGRSPRRHMPRHRASTRHARAGSRTHRWDQSRPRTHRPSRP